MVKKIMILGKLESLVLLVPQQEIFNWYHYREEVEVVEEVQITVEPIDNQVVVEEEAVHYYFIQQVI
jgi:hypothetical protein